MNMGYENLSVRNNEVLKNIKIIWNSSRIQQSKKTKNKTKQKQIWGLQDYNDYNEYCIFSLSTHTLHIYSEGGPEDKIEPPDICTVSLWTALLNMDNKGFWFFVPPHPSALSSFLTK